MFYDDNTASLTVKVSVLVKQIFFVLKKKRKWKYSSLLIVDCKCFNGFGWWRGWFSDGEGVGDGERVDEEREKGKDLDLILYLNDSILK